MNEPAPAPASMRAASTVLVTGASAGIGRELAKAAVETCDTLVLVARRRERLEELAAELEGLRPGVRALPWPADLADTGERRALPAALAAQGVTVDWLVNNAGFGAAGRFDEIDAERLLSMVEVDVAALHHLCRLFLPGMVARGRGGVLNVASTAAYQPLPWMATYGAAKAFVLSLSEALWEELRGSGVAVTCLCPGRTRTEFFAEADMEGIPFMKVPAADPAQVARAGWQGLLDGKRVVVPGVQNRLNAALVPRLPRRPVLAVTGKLFRR
jgi:hypothetical protein